MMLLMKSLTYLIQTATRQPTQRTPHNKHKRKKMKTHNIQEEINKKQYLIYSTAKWSNKKNRFRLKEKHLLSLEDEVREYAQDACTYSNTEEENTLVQWITIGAIEEVIDVLMLEKKIKRLKDERDYLIMLSGLERLGQ